MSKPAEVLFIGSTYAGHHTRFVNLRAFMQHEAPFRSRFVEVTGWRDGGLFERLPAVPRGMRGYMRSGWQARAFVSAPRPAVTWTSAWDVAPMFMWTQLGRLATPLVLDTDATYAQLNAMAPHYKGRPPASGHRLALRLWLERQLIRRTTIATPWSNWAAEGLRDAGMPADRIHVIPPGVDLEAWRFDHRLAPSPDRPLRLLFVGGDFERKGGDTLLRLVAGPLAGRVCLDVVTRDTVPATPGVTVHRAEANSPGLKRLFQQADVFVLPTRAECFGIACVEAMAAGLPVIMGDVGGARDIVVDGETGWLTSPDEDAVCSSIERAIASRAELPRLGANARRRAEEHFDAAANHARLVELLSGLISMGAGSAR